MHPIHLILAFVSASVAMPRKDGYEVGWNPYRAAYAYEDIDPRNVDGLGLGGGNLLRSLEMALRANPEAFSRQQRNLDSLSGITFGGSKRFDPSIPAFGGVKRSFDEIDRAGFNSFIKKRNFDEIDRTGFDSFVKKRNFDEIDRTGFNSFVKKRNFDEIDRTGFNSFVKRDVPQMPSNLEHQSQHSDKN